MGGNDHRGGRTGEGRGRNKLFYYNQRGEPVVPFRFGERRRGHTGIYRRREPVSLNCLLSSRAISHNIPPEKYRLAIPMHVHLFEIHPDNAWYKNGSLILIYIFGGRIVPRNYHMSLTHYSTSDFQYRYASPQ